MIEERELRDDERLQVRQLLEDIAQPVGARAIVDLGQRRRKM